MLPAVAVRLTVVPLTSPEPVIELAALSVVEAVVPVPTPALRVMLPEFAVNEMLLALICPAPVTVIPLLFVNWAVFATLKLVALTERIPADVLLMNAEPEVAVAVKLLVWVLIALPAPVAPMSPVPAVSPTVVA